MDAVQRKFVLLNENWVYARAPLTGEVRRVPVRLRYTDYQVELARNARGKPTLWTGKKACFELISEEPYDWAVWVNMPSWAGEFTIFNLPDNTSYIAFVVGKSLTLADVSVPVNASVALQQQEGTRPERLLNCPLSSLAPKVDRWAKGMFKNASRLELAFQSLDKLHDGSLRLTVADPQGNDSVSLRVPRRTVAVS